MTPRMLLLFAPLLACLGGCATDKTLWVYSEPQGAYITQLNAPTSGAMAPASIHYEISQLQNKDATGCSLVRGVEAHWVSGATARTQPAIRLCGNRDTYSITLSRDSSYPDLDKDLQFALQLQSTIAQQQQANAANRAAKAAMVRAFRDAQRPIAPPSPQGIKPFGCTTNTYGTTTYTNCQ